MRLIRLSACYLDLDNLTVYEPEREGGEIRLYLIRPVEGVSIEVDGKDARHLDFVLVREAARYHQQLRDVTVLDIAAEQRAFSELGRVAEQLE